MSTVIVGTPETITLPAGHLLTVVADVNSSGRVWPFAQRVGDTAGLSAVAASATVLIGPYASVTRYQIETLTGALTYTAALADFPTSAEAAAAAQIIADTEEAAAVAAAAITAQGYATTAQANAIAAAAAADWTIIGTIGTLCEVIGAGVPATSVQATLDVNPAGDDNGLTFTAVDYGASGNSISITYVDPDALSAALSVAVVASDITVNLATDGGVQASLTVNPAGDDNSLTFTAVAYGPGGNDITIEYVDPVDPASNATLSVDVVGTAITVNLATDGAGAITSTAALVLAAIEASGPAAALVTVAIDASDTGVADDGSGIVTAMALANLTSGANGAITSTAALILAAIEADEDADALVAVTIMTGDTGEADDGSGVVTAMAQDLLTGGTGIAIATAGKGSRYTDTTNGTLYINTGTIAAPVWTQLASVA